MKPIFCGIADDDTGATDLAGMLSGEGLRTVLVIEGPAQSWADGYDAVISGVGTRALQPSEAYLRTRAAVKDLVSLAPRVLQIKYCSTFDSTPEGNIGPSLDAAMDEAKAEFTVALPALPINGRTTYMGHHFVHGRLLSESTMRDHPLTPMHNPNLVTHLQSQTRRRVGLASYAVTADKLARLRSAGVEIAILDCISDDDLAQVCEAICELPLISGSSAPAMRLPNIWRRKGWWHRPASHVSANVRAGSGFLIAAGSCSTATQAQNEWLESQGAECVVMDPIALLAEDVQVPGWSSPILLLRTASSASDVARVKDWAASQKITLPQAGLRIAYSMARVVRRLVESHPPAGLIIAGGETSGAICRTLPFRALEVSQNIEPGIPLCLSLGSFRLPIALKSGNFGSVDFYGRAISRMKELT